MANTYVTGTSPEKTGALYTYREYKTWGENERWELFYGVPVAMSPAPQRRHQSLLGQIFSLLDAYFRGKLCRPLLAPLDVFLDEERKELEEADLVLQPDLMVVCDPEKLIEEGVRGAPDFIIEILSPATAMRDQTDKKILYETKGVREYWVVNPQSLEVFRYILENGRYGLAKPGTLRTPLDVEIFPGLSLVAREEDL
jgi:Uma2 family endonuclease